MALRDVPLEAEFIEQRRLLAGPLAHHRHRSCQPRGLNQTCQATSTTTFSTQSAQSGRLWRAVPPPRTSDNCHLDMDLSGPELMQKSIYLWRIDCRARASNLEKILVLCADTAGCGANFCPMISLSALSQALNGFVIPNSTFFSSSLASCRRSSRWLGMTLKESITCFLDACRSATIVKLRLIKFSCRGIRCKYFSLQEW